MMKMAKLKEKVTKAITKENVKTFVKENGVFMLQLAVMGAIMIHSGDNTAFANQEGVATGEQKKELTTLTGPLQNIQYFMTGTVPTALVSAGVVMAGASYAMNIDNQAVKSFMRIGGGGSIALGASKFIGEVSGILF